MANSTPKPPPTAPSRAGKKVMDAVHLLVNDRTDTTPDGRAQKVVDLIHIEATIRQVLGGAIADAIRTREGGIGTRELHRRSGLAPETLERRARAAAQR